MTEIIVIGNEKDTTLERLIKETLTKTYRVLYIKNNRFTDLGKGYELVVFDSRSPVTEGISAPIIIAKRHSDIPCDIPPASTSIINADNSIQLNAVIKSGSFAIPCGISSTSTVSFSSENEETAVISLNRSIRALSGKEIQPLEIPVSKHGSDIYTLMSFTALRLLLDDFESELGTLM